MNSDWNYVSAQTAECLCQLIGKQLAICGRIPFDEHYLMDEIAYVPFYGRVKTLAEVGHVVVISTDQHRRDPWSFPVLFEPQPGIIISASQRERGLQLQLIQAISNSGNH